jgi:hypothetical protein
MSFLFALCISVGSQRHFNSVDVAYVNSFVCEWVLFVLCFVCEMLFLFVCAEFCNFPYFFCTVSKYGLFCFVVVVNQCATRIARCRLSTGTPILWVSKIFAEDGNGLDMTAELK